MSDSQLNADFIHALIPNQGRLEGDMVSLEALLAAKQQDFVGVISKACKLLASQDTVLSPHHLLDLRGI